MARIKKHRISLASLNPLLRWKKAFLPPSVFMINPFGKKIFVSNQLNSESKFITNNSFSITKKFAAAKVIRSVPIFEVSEVTF